MSRYQPLADYLAAKKADHWEASFADIEGRLGYPLPQSAYRYSAWWANQSGSGHSQTRGWRSVGWRTMALDLERQKVRFEREPDASRTSGPTANDPDEREMFARAEAVTGIRDRGALVAEALRALIARESGLRLARLGGSMPDYSIPPRERSEL